ncbi:MULTISPECIES: hypothetical protein [unclassified Pseudomonas]|uniref:hypothetical protein n=1 Tax=unclassified Pseudomonas TaxID=196821 RepID=UPI0024491F7C|nr:MULTISPECIES: hypothetical protein [unclassified Pseudomonas]MDH0300545.1 hypothetical protein [Pseudomonas sp. GD04091]MDH1984304.1 hypothetical protein [Pseudomonas sp. GD03689]
MYKYKVRLVKLPGYPMPLLLFVALALQCRGRADLACRESNKRAQNREQLMKFSHFTALCGETAVNTGRGVLSVV